MESVVLPRWQSQSQGRDGRVGYDTSLDGTWRDAVCQMSAGAVVWKGHGLHSCPFHALIA